ncbi:MAG: hypothetical protein EA427_02350 [Spirochaetaceae bacterium]|nr:MAG: hypothetical protein EA427_02350 [Spirochaetaceae bacterium]
MVYCGYEKQTVPGPIVMQYPDYIHWCSWSSRVSLELPFRFEEGEEDRENACATYSENTGGDGGPGTMVMSRVTSVPVDQEEAFIKLAEESSRIPPEAACTRRDTYADGVPALEQELSFVDERVGGPVVRRELFAQIGNLVFSLAALIPRDRAAAQQQELDHTFGSLRFVLIPALERYGRTFCHGGAQVSVHIPTDWDVQEISEQQVRFFGPPSAQHDDYRPTFSVALGKPEGFGDEWLEGFLDQIRANMAESYRNFTIDSLTTISLSSLVEAHVMQYRWEPEPGLAFVQIQALIVVDMFRMYLINAASLEPLAETYLPVFEEILRSLRILGQPPTG